MRLLIRGIYLSIDEHKDEQGNITESFQRFTISFAYSRWPDRRYECTLIRPKENAFRDAADEYYRQKTNTYMIEMAIVRARHIAKHEGLLEDIEFEDRDEIMAILNQAQIDFITEQPWKATLNYNKDGANIVFEHRLNHESQMYQKP